MIGIIGVLDYCLKEKKPCIWGKYKALKGGEKKVKDIIQENLDIICKLRKKDISIIGYSALEAWRTAYSEVIEADIYTGDSGSGTLCLMC